MRAVSEHARIYLRQTTPLTHPTNPRHITIAPTAPPLPQAPPSPFFIFGGTNSIHYLQNGPKKRSSRPCRWVSGYGLRALGVVDTTTSVAWLDSPFWWFRKLISSRNLGGWNWCRTQKKSKLGPNCFNFAQNWCDGDPVVSFTTRCKQIAKNHTFFFFSKNT